ncbi:cell division protein SepF [Streptomyces sp. NPDC051940]|uniref:cell division protein SepF n=1 Tax=Streptomyces sp. NPDC051940 TaxID=3155675 RepID=UPI003425A4A4
MNGQDVTDEQWRGLAEVVPLRGNEWPSWTGHETLPDVEPAEDARRFVVIRCQCFADARQVAEYLIAQIPVLLDLTVAEHDVAKRILDFASGVTFGIRSTMHRVDRNVFLLAPVGTEVEPVAGR